MALSKSQVAQAVADELGEDDFTKQDIILVLNALAEVAAAEIALGEDFAVPGIARVSFRYTKPRRKGETYVGFGGEELVADQNRPAKVRMAASPAGSLKSPHKNAMADPKSKLFKAVAKAKG